jgi:ABC-type bacteriocin/lantibiotic exporter with double-glycine peptidase domain
VGSLRRWPRTGLDRIRELLSLPTENEEDSSKEAINEIQGEIEFEDVWFEYDAGVPV